MEGCGQVIKQLRNKLRKVRLLGEYPTEAADLLRRRHLAGKEKPEHALREHFLSLKTLRKHLLAVFNRLSMEANALVGI